MLALDTNTLVRLLVDDPQAMDQCTAVRARVVRERRAGRPIFVPWVVLVESAWVLTRAFAIPRARTVDILRMALEAGGLFTSAQDDVVLALTAAGKGKVGFADRMALIGAEAIDGATLLTFDRHLGRLEGTELLRPHSEE